MTTFDFQRRAPVMTRGRRGAVGPYNQPQIKSEIGLTSINTLASRNRQTKPNRFTRRTQ